MGINSIKRMCQFLSILSSANASISDSLTPGITTTFNFKGLKPTL
ncbi:hypothetical protein CY0110_17587 [Crocosphaera chwakensis CCY0110]|uniref:Uncharacterized protein n=1 Tax=Crocosphaera chwakensis CCY0110 TaxID=391612 RepID=A3IIJ9_9CHRO|nr:hypothetical protein CY0110_17587 [Crocosphaera chwakensis CCY0110]